VGYRLCHPGKTLPIPCSLPHTGLLHLPASPRLRLGLRQNRLFPATAFPVPGSTLLPLLRLLLRPAQAAPAATSACTCSPSCYLGRPRYFPAVRRASDLVPAFLRHASRYGACSPARRKRRATYRSSVPRRADAYSPSSLCWRSTLAGRRVGRIHYYTGFGRRAAGRCETLFVTCSSYLSSILLLLISVTFNISVTHLCLPTYKGPGAGLLGWRLRTSLQERLTWDLLPGLLPAHHACLPLPSTLYTFSARTACCLPPPAVALLSLCSHGTVPWHVAHRTLEWCASPASDLADLRFASGFFSFLWDMQLLYIF